MAGDSARIGTVSAHYTTRGLISSYSVEVWHDGLGLHRELRARDAHVLENKVDALVAQWATRWSLQKERDARQRSAEGAAAETVAARAALDECEALLRRSLDRPAGVDWETLKETSPFTYDAEPLVEIVYSRHEKEPLHLIEPRRPVASAVGPEPKEMDFTPRKRWWYFMAKKTRIRLAEEAQSAFADAHASWLERRDGADRDHAKAVEEFEMELARRQGLLEAERTRFAVELAAFREMREASDAAVAELERSWRRCEADGVRVYVEAVLAHSEYPDWFDHDANVDYDERGNSLVVDFQLPAPEDLPQLERVTYVKSRDERSEKFISASRRDRLYDSVCRQIALRTLHEVLSSDEPGAIADVTFNGWVEAVNPATGTRGRACILSVRAYRDEFTQLNLENVDPRACLRQLRAVAASSLAGLAPVRPVLQLDKEDSRFVDSRAVMGGVDDSVNLAAMPWEDFEHLVRDLFGLIFSQSGGEVRVTQASRDGGVDAVAFDPDPIRGGKIVIQAKRYTNVVGVSAVRDLYGTVLNEGANRGILVTTSTYGPDAHKFALDKPLTLLDGAQLLGLLEQHGRHARIDIAEARALKVDPH